MSAETWQPGDPLYERGPYRDYFFNFRPIPGDDDFEEIGWADAASWPDPLPGRRITGDPFELFIKQWHEWNESGR